MNKDERLQLNRMLTENNVNDKTDSIRKLKHSELIKRDVEHMKLLKSTVNQEELSDKCFQECNFLSSKYTDIYNKLLKDELDLDILMEFLSELKKIEDGTLDQHEASFNIGKLLKKLYIDSALKKADKLNSQDKKPENRKIKQVTWTAFKKKIKD